MSRYINAAQTNAERPAAYVPSFTSIVSGLNHKAVENAPASPARAVHTVCMAGA